MGRPLRFRTTPLRRQEAARLVAGAAVLLGLWLGLGTGQAQALDWRGTQDLGTATSSFPATPSVAVAPNGTAFVLYTQYDGANSRATVVSRPPGGSFGPPQTLSVAGASVSSPDIAVDARGNATAVWVRSGIVQSAYRPAGASWSNADDVSDSGGGALGVSVSAGDGGDAVATWQRNNRAEISLRGAGSSSFGAPQAISAPSGVVSIYGTPRAAIDAQGDVVALWQQETLDSSSNGVYEMEGWTKPVGQSLSMGTLRQLTFGASSSAGTGAGTMSYDVRITDGGRATAMWDYETSSGSSVVQFADVGFPNPVWGSVGNASGNVSGQYFRYPSFGLDASGVLDAAWSRYDGTSTVNQAASRPVNSGFSAADISGPGVGSPVMGVAANGAATMLWTGSSGSTRAILSARRSPGGGFGDVVVAAASPTGGYLYQPAVGLDEQGDAVGAWISRSPSPSQYDTQVAYLDPVAPSIDRMDVPASATVGDVVSFGGAASDRFSGANLSWSFGDGDGAGGASPTHAYGTAGTYTVGLTATDGAGNASSSTRTITVNPAPAPPPPSNDADGDGYPVGVDCNDANAAIHPGAKEPAGGTIDFNCDGKLTPFPRVDAATTLGWDVLSNGRTRIKVLTLAGLAPGETVQLSCKGKKLGCRKKASRKIVLKAKAKPTLSLTTYVKGLSLKPKAQLVVKVSRTGYVAKTFRYTMVRRKDPKKELRCLAPGAKKSTPC